MAAEPVDWLPDGTPRSARFDDIYRTYAGGLAQARRVFLEGCALPAAWRGQRQWRVLETGFGLGLNFLATWQAWRSDSERPDLLHFASIEAWPVAAADLLRSAALDDDLLPLARELAAQWHGLLPGFHRLAFDDGRVLLTLCVGDVQEMLRAQDFTADSVFLDGFSPSLNAQMWTPHVFKAIARLCRRGTRLATWTSVGDVRRGLVQCGFAMEKTDGLAPKRHSLRGVYAPAWEPHGLRRAAPPSPSDCVVIGGGLAGAAAARSLAMRGWRVQVLDTWDRPACGASSLPAGLLAPHQSPDDSLLTRLVRAGLRISLQQAGALLRAGIDWEATGALEHRADALAALPAAHQEALDPWSQPASAAQKRMACLDADAPALWHAQAAWIKPAALVAAWLDHPGITWHGGRHVARLAQTEDGWQVLDATGGEMTRCALVVVAAAHAGAALMPVPMALQPVRGQVSWGDAAKASELPAFPLHGNGHLLPRIPMTGGDVWLCGSSYQRDDTDLAPRRADHAENLARLEVLAPAAAQQLRGAFETDAVQSWTQLRCVAADRRPLVGELADGFWISTAMGSRGLTFAALCGELMAARLHDEPLPLSRKLAGALDARRHLEA